MSDSSARSSLVPLAREWALPAGAVALLILLVSIVAQPGVPIAGAGGAVAFQVIIESGFAPLVWIIGALGLGHLLVRAITGRADVSWSMALSVGAALSFWLAHALGALGAWGGPKGPILAWTLPLVGTLWLLLLARRGDDRSAVRADPALLPWTALLALPAVAIALVAACAPPGTLWMSEAMGFDVLSYHLQLPREWLARGRIEPLEHNVYSFLPSYVEAAYMQLSAMRGGRDPSAGSGGATSSAQLLHVLLAIAAAGVVGRFATALSSSCSSHDADERESKTSTAAQRAGGFAAAIMLLTPWVVVTASLAYNEMAVLLCYAGALMVARAPALSPWARGALIGWLVGIACGAKLTSAYLVAPSVVLALVGWTPRAHWLKIALAGALAGALALSPWVARNMIEAGNPLFPFATSILGEAHWSSLEASRWSAGHLTDMDLLRRLSLLVSANRGLLHPQWSIISFVGLIALVITLRARQSRRVALVLGACLALTLTGWLAIGHLQSRFLLPIIIPIALLSGTAMAQIGRGVPNDLRRAGLWAVLAVPIVLGAFSTFTFLQQNGGAPNRGLVGGVAQLNGELAVEALAIVPRAEHGGLLGKLRPAALVNVLLGQGPRRVDRKLYLLGESRPYYYHAPVRYHTTWDASPLGMLLRDEGGDLARAAARLRDDLAITHVLVNLSELHRLHTLDAWYDPDVSPEVARALIAQHGAIIQSWPAPDGLGLYLIELTPNLEGGGL